MIARSPADTVPSEEEARETARAHPARTEQARPRCMPSDGACGSRRRWRHACHTARPRDRGPLPIGLVERHSDAQLFENAQDPPELLGLPSLLERGEVTAVQPSLFSKFGLGKAGLTPVVANGGALGTEGGVWAPSMTGLVTLAPGLDEMTRDW